MMSTPTDPVRESGAGVKTALNDLNQAASLLDKVTFDLADQVPSALVAQLVSLTGELEQIKKQLQRYATWHH
jgi:hypothetical protein